MRAKEIKGLMEAYSHVYETSEVLSEEVVEEDIEQLMERGAPTDSKARAAYDAQVAKNRAALGNTLLYGNAAGRKPEAPSTRNRNVRGGGTIKAGETTPAAKPKPTPAPAAAKPAPAAAKPAPTAAAKPTSTAPAAPTKPAGSAMDAWAKANPRLAQAQKIRQQGGSRAEVNKVLYNKGTAPTTSTPTVVKAGVDIFDLVKGHLLDEGYADSEEGAMVIMINMSEEWRTSILESYGVELDEAQESRENPEKHEEGEKKEHEKKYGHVRGEKTPMPPRGDKRREDFEKWYAKNVR